MRKQIILGVILILIAGGVGWFYLHTKKQPAAVAVSLTEDVYPLYTNLVWGTPSPTTTLSFGGYEAVSQPIKNISNLSAVFMPFEAYYKQKLEALGWSVDTSLAADGPGSSVTVYQKSGAYVVLSYNTVFNGGSANGPATCPCDVSFSVFTGEPVSSDYKNAPYMLGQPVTLVGGIARTQAAPGSASVITTRYFGNEASGDLNGDGIPDVAFILTQNTGGSGTFYYVVAALKTPTGYEGTSGVLLGDRIAPQTTQIKNGEIIVTYADRNPGEPMTAIPSLGISKYLKVEGSTLVQIAASQGSPN